ncbi:MAG TPA: hypothetical protein VFH78_04180 [Candidatus Thermoplasmatota archaeon]|nr:hypothetical protein [Candidatus Thermoplasmatota archaeon]
MALRATSGPAPTKKSAKVGERVEFAAKVENTATAEESVALMVEELKEGALGKAVAFAFSLDPPAHAVPPKSRKALTFAWTAALPEGKTAFTFRGKLVLRRVHDGALVGSAPLDLYVAS